MPADIPVKMQTLREGIEALAREFSADLMASGVAEEIALVRAAEVVALEATHMVQHVLQGFSPQQRAAYDDIYPYTTNDHDCTANTIRTFVHERLQEAEAGVPR